MQLQQLPFDSYATIFMVGLLYTVMPLTVWTILRGRHDTTTTLMWCAGAGLSGISYLLFGMRPSLPNWVSFQLGNALGYLGYALRWAALRRERGLTVPYRLALLAVAVFGLMFSVVALIDDMLRQVFNILVLFGGSSCIAFQAWQLAREARSRSAVMVSWAYIALSLALLIRLGGLVSGLGSPAPFGLSADIALLLAMGMLAALWGNIGYLGVAMEAARRRERLQRAELAGATARSEQAERQAAELKALSEERQELLRVISHEVRQPLHNAQAVLQGVEGALHSEQARGEEAAARFARARSVLRQITASLDNTLAVSTLLVEGSAPPLRDADVAMMVELCLGDLPPLGRARVLVAYEADVRTAAMDVGLMRLALRNLLNNALAYALPGSPVTLRISDSDEPLLLRLEVEDVGPPIAAELLPKLFDRGSRGRHDLPGQGLGLYIVRQAMRRQGGSVEVNATAQGNRFTLLLPQGVEPA